MSENYEISLKDWKEMEQASCLLLDVRDNMAFQYGHIGDAINLPLEELKEQIEKNELSEQLKQNKKIIVYCKRGEASAEATALLREPGVRCIQSHGRLYGMAAGGYRTGQ